MREVKVQVDSVYPGLMVVFSHTLPATEAMLRGRVGEVHSIDRSRPNSRTVRVHVGCSHSLGYLGRARFVDRNGRLHGFFGPEELEPVSSELQLSTRIRLLFPEAHSFEWAGVGWSKKSVCMHTDHDLCAEPVPAVLRALICCNGTVFEVDVCDRHQHLHGLRINFMPWYTW
jgi:hypothetical protein